MYTIWQSIQHPSHNVESPKGKERVVFWSPGAEKCKIDLQGCSDVWHTQKQTISLTSQHAGQSSASLPCRLLCVSTETDVSRDSGLSGLLWGVEHVLSTSHSQTNQGAACSNEPRLHNLGQCCRIHPHGAEEGSPKRGAQTSQAHMDPSIQPRSHPLSAAVLDPDAMISSET